MENQCVNCGKIVYLGKYYFEKSNTKNKVNNHDSLYRYVEPYHYCCDDKETSLETLMSLIDMICDKDQAQIITSLLTDLTTIDKALDVQLNSKKNR